MTTKRTAPDSKNHAPDESCPNSTDEGASAFVPTPRELEVLAQDYLDEIRSHEYEWEVLGSTSGRYGRFAVYAVQRISMIERFLGREILSKALAPTNEKWSRRLADAKQTCQRAGVDEAMDLDPLTLRELAAAAGFAVMPLSALHPMDELFDQHHQRKGPE